MFEQDSALAHRACKIVAFLDRVSPDFMSTCCSVLTRFFYVFSTDQLRNDLNRQPANGAKPYADDNYQRLQSATNHATQLSARTHLSVPFRLSDNHPTVSSFLRAKAATAFSAS